jgi:hypothetical protein
MGWSHILPLKLNAVTILMRSAVFQAFLGAVLAAMEARPHRQVQAAGGHHHGHGGVRAKVDKVTARPHALRRAPEMPPNADKMEAGHRHSYSRRIKNSFFQKTA